ncbi:5'-3' exoribonuclease [Planctomycetaceae bacterium]|nr:5'-3' exoribonuclease [Planctomycetaceae bacterium]
MGNQPCSYADLHSHTTASDGTLAPRDLLKTAFERGVRHLALTDHDTTSGHAEASAAAAEFGIDFIPGVEITCEAAGTEVHLLGLGVNSANAGLQELCLEMQRRRSKRFADMHALLLAHGLRFELPLIPAGVSPSRPALARAIVAAGHAASEDEAFARYLRKGRPGFLPNRREPIKSAVDAIHGAGGIAILAHPGLYPNDSACIDEAIAAGADGLECVHPDHDEVHVQRYTTRARKLGLLISGGADFHGFGHPRSHFFGKKFCPSDEFIRLQMAMSGRSERKSL